MKPFTAIACAACLAIAAGVGTATFFFGGVFSVAASERDPALVNWALVHVREASITRHATDQPPMSLDDASVVQGGAQAYASLGCQSCHGGLGVKPARFSQGLNPQPNLKAVIEDITPPELFWVLKNGIKMTGMPSFGTGKDPVPDAELWSVTAFLKRVPSLSSDDLAKWTAAHHG
ncbi:c-type cytochrome [Lichenifustis flavocetrariae]|uniref:Cytochrome c n=1 Tax=Lichenifustis flavocetrariae TaxID=2949735 RepID=A0AA42CMQ1_9HYPH|nr:cytochrome c [Lichenifustis flavocetrariae]MCW6511821.1 cytochrome c [Lichenifustis flavocetrariae]